MSTQRNQKVLENAVAEWNKGNLDAYLQLYHPDILMHGLSGVEPGIDSVRNYYSSFWAAFRNPQLTLDDIMTEGDKLACRFTISGTHTGTFGEIPATGKEVAIGGLTILRFADGRCVERWTQADFLGLLQQLGAIPAPA